MTEVGYELIPRGQRNLDLRLEKRNSKRDKKEAGYLVVNNFILRFLMVLNQLFQVGMFYIFAFCFVDFNLYGKGFNPCSPLIQ